MHACVLALALGGAGHSVDVAVRFVAGAGDTSEPKDFATRLQPPAIKQCVFCGGDWKFVVASAFPHAVWQHLWCVPASWTQVAVN